MLKHTTCEVNNMLQRQSEESKSRYHSSSQVVRIHNGFSALRLHQRLGSSCLVIELSPTLILSHNGRPNPAWKKCVSDCVPWRCRHYRNRTKCGRSVANCGSPKQTPICQYVHISDVSSGVKALRRTSITVTVFA